MQEMTSSDCDCIAAVHINMTMMITMEKTTRMTGEDHHDGMFPEI